MSDVAPPSRTFVQTHWCSPDAYQGKWFVIQKFVCWWSTVDVMLPTDVCELRSYLSAWGPSTVMSYHWLP